MKKSTVISLLKLLAIYIFYQAVLRLEISMFSTFNFFEPSSLDNKYKILQLLSGWIPLLLNIAFGCILWIKADKISSKIVISAEGINNSYEIKNQNIDVILCSLLGLYLLFECIPELSKTIYIMKATWVTDYPNSDEYKRYIGIIISLTIRIALSLWLIFGAKWWVNLICTVRNYKNIMEKKSDGHIS